MCAADVNQKVTGLFTVAYTEKRTGQTATTDLYVEHDYGK